MNAGRAIGTARGVLLALLTGVLLPQGLNAACPVSFSADALSLASHGGALVAGDFNRDGLQDVAVLLPADGVVSIFLATPSGGFLHSQDLTTGPAPASIAAADFNSDGSTDLVVSIPASQIVEIALGDFEGTFGPFVPLPVDLEADVLATGDLKNDYLQDLVLVDAQHNRVSVLLGNGDGSFRSPRHYSVGSLPSSIALTDADGDGSLDILVGDGGSSDIAALLGNGDGTFKSALFSPAGYPPSAIAAADFNLDSRVDLALVSAAGGATQVLLGQGDGTFQQGFAEVVGVSPQGLAAGDFDGDALPDLAVADPGSNNVWTLQGNGDGTLQPPVQGNVGDHPSAIISADLNADGKVDLLMTSAATHTLDVLLNTTDRLILWPEAFDGTWAGSPFERTVVGNLGAPPYSYAVSSGSLPAGISLSPDGLLSGTPASTGFSRFSIRVTDANGCVGGRAYVWQILEPDSCQMRFQPGTGLSAPFNIASGLLFDLDSDGLNDIAVASPYTNEIALYRGLGQGHFQPLLPITVPGEPTQLAAVDLNGDGAPDLVYLDPLTNAFGVLMANGDGTYQPPLVTALGSAPSSMAVADFNGDGIPDLAIAYGPVSAFLGNGDGTFRPQPTLVSGLSLEILASADFNGDGIPDLAAASTYPGGNSVEIYFGDGEGSFTYFGYTPLVSSPTSLASADFNGDGHPDLAVQLYPGSVLPLLGSGDGTFLPGQAVPTTLRFGRLLAVDVNGDGTPDLVTAAAQVLIGDGQGAFSVRAGYSQETIAVGDADGDGIPDLVVSTDGIEILHGLGDGTFLSHILQAGYDGQIASTADLNGDGVADVIVYSYTDMTLQVWLGRLDGYFDGPADYTFADYINMPLIADINGDGKKDILVSTYSGSILELFGNGDGSFSPPTLLGDFSGSAPAYLGDLNHDGIVDAILQQGNNAATISVMLGNGDGSFSPQVTYPAATGYLAVGDVNGDGNVDIVISDDTNNDIQLLLGNPDGSFQAPRVAAGITNPLNIRLADFNGDGQLDIAAVQWGVQGISVLLGNGDGSFQDPVTAPLTYYPGAIVAADVNTDGRTDLIALNEIGVDGSLLLGNGDGTFAPAFDIGTAGFPTSAAVVDVNRDGRPDILVTDLFFNTLWTLLNETLALPASSIPAGTLGSPYDFWIPSLGGQPPLSFSVSSGSLPAGLDLSSEGELVGTPTQAGVSSFTIHVVESEGCAADAAYQLEIYSTNPVPVITDLSLTCVPPGSGPTTLVISGSNFVVGASVIIGNSALPASDLSGDSLSVSMPASLTSVPAVLPVQVVNPTPGGGGSPPAYLVVDYYDVAAGSPLAPFICTVTRDSITAGCGGGNFCPNDAVLRSSMAIFLLRAEHGSNYTPPPAVGIFGDVPASNPFAPWIEQIYNEGITGGCSTNPLEYCPNSVVTRAGMAVFLLRAEHGSTYTPPAAVGIFGDVPASNPFAPWIEQLYSEGITGGCSSNPLEYCPANSVTRAQMAVFLVATFSLQ